MKIWAYRAIQWVQKESLAVRLFADRWRDLPRNTESVRWVQVFPILFLGLENIIEPLKFFFSTTSYLPSSFCFLSVRTRSRWAKNRGISLSVLSNTAGWATKSILVRWCLPAPDAKGTVNIGTNIRTHIQTMCLAWSARDFNCRKWHVLVSILFFFFV